MEPFAVDVLAGAGDTWGIPGPIFLSLYVIIMLGLMALALRTRFGGSAGVSRELHPYEAAYLAGNRSRAVTAALTVLRAEQAVEPAGGGRLRVTDGAPPRTTRTELDDAVYETIRRSREIKAAELTADPRVRGVLDGMRARLEKEGLLNGADRRAWMRMPAVALGALAGLALIRVIAGVQNGKPVGLLIAAMVVTVIVAVILAAVVPHVSRAGDRALAAAKRHNAHLDPSNSPAWATYGALGVAFGVALHGGAALTSFDPAFAEQAELNRHLGATGGGSGGGCGGGGGSCGGGGGCGGCGG